MIPKIIAFYLPQFHQFEENNRWWGEGFTEWTCVKRTKSLGDYHIVKRPHPDIGYYCLEDVEVRRKQALMAKRYGVHGFCYYHYWFGGKVLMQKTLEMMLADGQPDHPYCFSWANEPWTRRMNGGNGEVLQPANYGREDEWEAHLQYLLRFFRTENYIKIDNKPVFLIYRVSQIVNYQERFAYWRSRLKELGFNGIYLVMTVGNFHTEVYEPMLEHVDACVDFFPNWLGKAEDRLYVRNGVWHYDMNQAYAKMLESKKIHNVHFRGMLCGFDSYPRSGLQSNVFINNSPETYQAALVSQIRRCEDPFLFLNAWNEWGEGCCLEPDEHYGYQFLEATKHSLGACIF